LPESVEAKILNGAQGGVGAVGAPGIVGADGGVGSPGTCGDGADGIEGICGIGTSGAVGIEGACGIVGGVHPTSDNDATRATRPRPSETETFVMRKPSRLTQGEELRTSAVATPALLSAA
jgi:hypothetical protein